MAPLEPLKIDQLHMENGVGNVRVRALFNNLTILGAGNYSVITVKWETVTILKAKMNYLLLYQPMFYKIFNLLALPRQNDRFNGPLDSSLL